MPLTPAQAKDIRGRIVTIMVGSYNSQLSAFNGHADVSMELPIVAGGKIQILANVRVRIDTAGAVGMVPGNVTITDFDETFTVRGSLDPLDPKPGLKATNFRLDLPQGVRIDLLAGTIDQLAKEIKQIIGPGGVGGPTVAVYRVTTFTGDRFLAGTDAVVRVRLRGVFGESDRVVLDRPGNERERGDVDTFDLSLPELGNLTSLDIEHDNTGVGPGWFLEKVEVSNQTTGQSWSFPCRRWLATDEDDGQIKRTLTPT